MRVYVAGVSGEQQYVRGMVSLHNLNLLPGDFNDVEYGGRGDASREILCTRFLMQREYDALLMLDLDMDHPPDMLDRLRKDMTDNRLDMVTGHYFRRQVFPHPMLSIVSTISDSDTYPFMPLLNLPDSGLMEIACTGMGNVLIHRKVIEAVATRLAKGDNPFAIRQMPRFAGGSAQNWGTDYAFFTLARNLGFKLWLDCAIESSHAVTLWLNRDIYKFFGPLNDLTDLYFNYFMQCKEIYGMNEQALRARIAQLKNQAEGHQANAAKIRQQRDAMTQQIETEHELFKQVLSAIKENESWLGEVPTAQVRKVGHLPVFEREEDILAAMKDGKVAEEKDVRPLRDQVYSQEAMDHVNVLDQREKQA